MARQCIVPGDCHDQLLVMFMRVSEERPGAGADDSNDVSRRAAEVAKHESRINL
jgi:hypothetical protein